MLRLAVALVVGLLLGAAGWGAFVYVSLTKPVNLPPEGVTLSIEQGWGGAKIATELGQAGVISHPLFFRVAAKLNGVGNQFKAGRYRFQGNMNALDVQKILLEGQVLTRQFSIAEGLNQWQIAEKLATIFPEYDKSHFLMAFQDQAVLGRLPKSAKTAEGYLFPETYTVAEEAKPLDLALIMVAEWKKRVSPETLLRARDRGLDEHDLMTLASIVEKETGDPSERGLIAAVFHNRIRMKMKLQTDPTVIYGMWETYDGNIRKKDLLTPTPYNTYVIEGLPPGPIASPGADAIIKTAEPDNVDYLYFVARGDGSGLHDFSRTLEEHNRAVSRYVRRYRERIAR